MSDEPKPKFYGLFYLGVDSKKHLLFSSKEAAQKFLQEHRGEVSVNIHEFELES